MHRDLSPIRNQPGPRAPVPHWVRPGVAGVIAVMVALAAPGGDSTAQESGPAASQEAPDQRMDKALLRAVAEGDPGKVGAALKAGADPDVRVRPDGPTALMLAAERGHAEVVAPLLQAGARIDARSADGWTALMQAAYGRHAKAAQALLDAGADPTLREDRYGNTALLIAARRGADRTLAALLAHGADPNVQDTADGNTPLINAASAPFGRAPAIADRLLQAGASPDLAADDGFTPLMAAARTGAGEMAARLLNAGAKINRRNDAGGTALMLASAHGQAALVDRLLHAGGDPTIRNAKGNTALCLAIDSRARRSVDRLLATGEDEVLTTQCRDGLPPIARAAKLGDAGLVGRLLAAGADPDQPGAEGSTALMWAANRGAVAAVRQLLAAGADPRARAEDGWTPKKAAEMLGDPDVLKALERAR